MPKPKTSKPRNRETAKLQAGFSYIEIIIASGIFLIVLHALLTLISATYQLLGVSRIEASARALANEQMEVIRNLSFDDIGTQGGIPSGPLTQIQTKNLNGQDFTVTTSIIYIDDDYDDVSPTDTLPTDYKRARVTVSWDGVFPTEEIITLITDIAPKGVESITGGGTLQILVFDSLGQPVPQAEISIEAPSAIPPVDTDLFTDDFGNLILPGAPACTGCYNITVTKENYSTDRTYTTAEVTNPAEPPTTILEGQVSQVSFGIDQLSTVTINSIGNGPTYPSIGNVPFHLTSSKTIGTNALGENVYKLDQDYTTDGSGSLELQLEWDTYQLTLDNTTYDLGGSNPSTPIAISANQTINIGFIATGHTDHSLLSIVQDASASVIPNATTRLFNTSLSYEETATTGADTNPDYGQTLFNNLTNNTYQLEISHPNFEIATQSVDISGPTQTTIILNPL